MDLIYTNSNKADQGVLTAYSFDLSFGASENDFEIILGADEPPLEPRSFVYIEGTEYGGIVDGMKASTTGETVTYLGRTWHGVLNSKVIEPNAGQAYFSVSGEANSVISEIVSRLGLGDMFTAAEEQSGISLSRYQFNRYCLGYDGLRAMLAANGAKLKVSFRNRSVYLSAEPVADHSEPTVNGDIATLTVERHDTKVNHLVCLGKGELTEREVVHLYADQFGRIGDTQYYRGLEEVSAVYDNSNTDDLRKDGVAKLTELRDNDKADISIPETDGIVYDIGDIVGANEQKSGVKVTSAVSQKIVKINNGVIKTEYKVGS